jgi:hypothetical protein
VCTFTPQKRERRTTVKHNVQAMQQAELTKHALQERGVGGVVFDDQHIVGNMYTWRMR